MGISGIALEPGADCFEQFESAERRYSTANLARLQTDRGMLRACGVRRNLATHGRRHPAQGVTSIAAGDRGVRVDERRPTRKLGRPRSCRGAYRQIQNGTQLMPIRTTLFVIGPAIAFLQDYSDRRPNPSQTRLSAIRTSRNGRDLSRDLEPHSTPAGAETQNAPLGRAPVFGTHSVSRGSVAVPFFSLELRHFNLTYSRSGSRASTQERSPA